MELREFVAGVLTDICKGIRQAQEQTKDAGAFICPRMRYDNETASEGIDATTAQSIEFDVAVEVSSKTEQGASGKAGISIFRSVMSVAGELKGSKTESGSSVSRIRFSLPVVWPAVVHHDEHGFVPPADNHETYDPLKY